MAEENGSAPADGGVPSATPAQPLSGKDYAVIGLVLFVFGAGLLLAFVFLAPKLLPSGLLDQFYYIVVIMFGLFAAVILFGVMKSYASLTVKQPPGTLLELGGPAVVAALVVFGGIEFVPHAQSFNVVVRPHAQGTPIISSGKIRLEYGANPAERSIDSSGDAEFREIPRQYSGQEVKLLPEVDGYEREYQTISLDPAKPVIDVQLKRKILETRIIGKLIPPPQAGKTVKILVEGEAGEIIPDEFGRFEATVHKETMEQARFSVWINGKQVYDNYQPLSAAVTLVLANKSN